MATVVLCGDGHGGSSMVAGDMSNYNVNLLDFGICEL